MFDIFAFFQEVTPITVKYADGEKERLGSFLIFKELFWELIFLTPIFVNT